MTTPARETKRETPEQRALAEWPKQSGGIYTTAEKIIHLQSSRADLIRQMRREVHTSRSTRGIERHIEIINRQLAALRSAT